MQRYRNYPNKQPVKTSPPRATNWFMRLKFVQKFMRLSRKRKILLAAWVIASVLVVTALATAIYFANTLGSKESIMNRNKTGVTLVDVKNRPYYEFYNATSATHVPLNKISDSAKEALIAAEDKNFYKHRGFSPLGIIFALWQNVKPNGLDSGGSTITQQLVKNALLTKDRSLIRKYQELVLSLEIERRYSKDEILEMYLNSVYFGEGAFGIEDAAKTYFNKSASKLNASEAAILVGLLPAPSAWSPISGDPESSEKRQDYVLERMKEEGYITAQQAKTADARKLNYAEPDNEAQRAPHFALMVRDQLVKEYGEQQVSRSGFKVKTTLNLDWQDIAEKAVEDQVNLLAGNNVSNGGAVVIDPTTGEVRALVGSKDWNNNKFGKLNIATANRQPGSSFKPFVYATGIEEGTLTAATILHDKPTSYGGYSPKNYDLRYRGNVTTRRSLANSLNTTAVEAMNMTGIDDVISQTKELGLTTLSDEVDYGLPLALGAGEAKLTEMTNAYATFANEGRKNEITTYTSIEDKGGKTIFTYKPENERVISDETAYIMSSMLSDNTARAETFGSSLTIDRPAAVKTGTTENYRDAWTIGYTPNLAVGVWIGNNDGTLMSSVAGSSGAAPIWRNIMMQALAGTNSEQFVAPAGIAVRDICRNNGGVAARAGTNTYKEYFKAGSVPTKSCTAQEKKPKEEKKKEEEPEEEAPVEEPTEEEPIEPTDPEDEEPTDPEVPTGGGGGILNAPGHNKP